MSRFQGSDAGIGFLYIILVTPLMFSMVIPVVNNPMALLPELFHVIDYLFICRYMQPASLKDAAEHLSQCLRSGPMCPHFLTTHHKAANAEQ